MLGGGDIPFKKRNLVMSLSKGDLIRLSATLITSIHWM